MVDATKTAPAKAMPKWESDCRTRLATAIRGRMAILANLAARDANEGETRLLVTEMLEALGFDKYNDLTMEYQVKGEFADYGIRIEKQLVAFVEVKRIAQKLNQKHLNQVQTYSVNEGVEWMILTNGQMWQVYHLTNSLPLIVDQVMAVDLLDSQTTLNEKIDVLFYLTKEAFKRKLIDDFWRQRAATSPRAIASALLSDRVLDELRKELRTRSAYNAGTDELAALMRQAVLRADVLP
jgi:predicted type IV restriction endonuclease